MANKPKNFPTKTYDEIIVPNKLFEINGIEQEKVKERIISDTEFEFKMLVNSSSSYTTLLWKDLGVIHYE